MAEYLNFKIPFFWQETNWKSVSTCWFWILVRPRRNACISNQFLFLFFPVKSIFLNPSIFYLSIHIVPSGKPTITAAHNTSSTSIQLVWRPPSKNSINGEFLGYRISYRLRNNNDNNDSEQQGSSSSSKSSSVETTLKDPDVTHYTIQDLEAFTQYLVSLQIVNPAGLGPPTTVVVMTDEGGKLHIFSVKLKYCPQKKFPWSRNIAKKNFFREIPDFQPCKIRTSEITVVVMTDEGGKFISFWGQLIM